MVMPAPPFALVPFDEMNWKQSTSPFSFRWTFQQNVAWPLPLCQSMPTMSPRRILFESTRVPRLSAITDPAEWLMNLKAEKSWASCGMRST